MVELGGRSRPAIRFDLGYFPTWKYIGRSTAPFMVMRDFRIPERAYWSVKADLVGFAGVAFSTDCYNSGLMVLTHSRGLPASSRRTSNFNRA